VLPLTLTNVLRNSCNAPSVACEVRECIPPKCWQP
jgi:hypothetical protein